MEMKDSKRRFLTAVVCILTFAAVFAFNIKTVTAEEDETQQETTETAAEEEGGEPETTSETTSDEDGTEPETTLKDPEPDGKKTAELTIDNMNCYEGMEKTYSQGYMPKIENQTAQLVVPVLCNETLKNERLTVHLNLGNSSDIPFVYRNYEKTVFLEQHSVNDESGTVQAYVARFDLELKDDRYNGNYPVELTVTAWDCNGNKIEKTITIYIAVTDGRNRDAEPFTLPEPETSPSFAPKIIIEDYEFSKEQIVPGDEVDVTIRLKNTGVLGIRNLTVAFGVPAQYFILLSKTDRIWLDAIPAGETKEVTFTCEARTDAPWGQYDLKLNYDYADSKGSTYAGEGTVKLMVGQVVRLEFDELNIASSMRVGDVVQARLHVMNLGKGTVFNIRARIEADGISPEETLFIGNLDAGKTAEGTVKVQASGLVQGTSVYGKTQGIVTILYEDASGKEYEETLDFFTTITSPFSGQEIAEEDEPGQWWVIIAVIAAVLCVFTGTWIVQRQKEKRWRK